MKRTFRLTSSIDIKRVRRYGSSLAHPLLVLLFHPNELQRSRFAVSAGRSVGGAVERNRAKRLLREALNDLLPNIPSGWDFVVIAREPLAESSFQEARSALQSLLNQSGLIDQPYDHRKTL